MKEFNPNFDYVQIDPQVMAKTMGGNDSLLEDYDTSLDSASMLGLFGNTLGNKYEKAEVPNTEFSIDTPYGWGDSQGTKSSTKWPLSKEEIDFINSPNILEEILKELKEIKIILAGRD